MPSLTEKITAQALDAAYTAAGLPLLVLDEINERLATPRAMADEQADIARKHAKDASGEWQEQFDALAAQLRDMVPTELPNLTSLTEMPDLPFQPLVRQGFEAVEPTMTRIAGMAPEPFAAAIEDSIDQARSFLADSPAEEVVVETKKAAKKTPAKKTKAKAKSTAKKTPAKKTAAKAKSTTKKAKAAKK